jgi:hypothetical protein
LRTGKKILAISQFNRGPPSGLAIQFQYTYTNFMEGMKIANKSLPGKPEVRKEEIKKK